MSPPTIIYCFLPSNQIPQQLSLVEPAENMAAFEDSLLVTSLTGGVITIVQHYRDRADCENNFDEIKNQWGWGSFVTQTSNPDD